MAQNLFSRRRQTKRKQKAKRHSNEFLDDQPDTSLLRTLNVEKLSHEGRGIAKHNGKTQFIEGALISETVKARMLHSHNSYDELQTIEVLTPSPDRTTPFCEHFDLCGGCSLQNMTSDAQLQHKEAVLKEQYAHFGQVLVKRWLDPIKSLSKAYRSKARLGVYYDSNLKKTIVGFREKQTKRLTDIQTCPILEPALERLVPTLHALIDSLEASKAITHIELASSGDQQAMVLRHIKPFSDEDLERLNAYAETYKVRLYLQANSNEQAQAIADKTTELTYSISAQNTLKDQVTKLSLAYHPQDFTQVNALVNQKLINCAIEHLALQASDKVLDLFCGLGNFTLPIALNCHQVTGVEGSDAMVSRAQLNAKQNQIGNTEFFSADLHADFRAKSWAKQKFDKILIDPPRAGALAVCNFLHHFDAERIVYISCNPATLARDAGVLSTHGYQISASGVVDMFPNTAHIESIAVFVRQKK